MSSARMILQSVIFRKAVTDLTEGRELKEEPEIPSNGIVKVAENNLEHDMVVIRVENVDTTKEFELDISGKLKLKLDGIETYFNDKIHETRVTYEYSSTLNIRINYWKFNKVAIFINDERIKIMKNGSFKKWNKYSVTNGQITSLKVYQASTILPFSLKINKEGKIHDYTKEFFISKMSRTEEGRYFCETTQIVNDYYFEARTSPFLPKLATFYEEPSLEIESIAMENIDFKISAVAMYIRGTNDPIISLRNDSDGTLVNATEYAVQITSLIDDTLKVQQYNSYTHTQLLKINIVQIICK